MNMPNFRKIKLDFFNLDGTFFFQNLTSCYLEGTLFFYQNQTCFNLEGTFFVQNLTCYLERTFFVQTQLFANFAPISIELFSFEPDLQSQSFKILCFEHKSQLNNFHSDFCLITFSCATVTLD